jgi:hypothetical protein
MIYILNMFSNFNWQFCTYVTTYAHLIESAVYLSINLPDDDFVQVETCKRDVRDGYLLLTVQFVGLNTV